MSITRTGQSTRRSCLCDNYVILNNYCLNDFIDWVEVLSLAFWSEINPVIYQGGCKFSSPDSGLSVAIAYFIGPLHTMPDFLLEIVKGL